MANFSSSGHWSTRGSAAFLFVIEKFFGETFRAPIKLEDLATSKECLQNNPRIRFGRSDAGLLLTVSASHFSRSVPGTATLRHC